MDPELCSHPLVIEEVALDCVSRRDKTLELLGHLPARPTVSHQELPGFVSANRLWAGGLSPVDSHLLGSTTVAARTSLWWRDKRLHAVAAELGAGRQA